MTEQEFETRKNGIVREAQRLLIDMEEIERKIPEKEVAKRNEGILDFYVPKGLRNIHRLPRLGM